MIAGLFFATPPQPFMDKVANAVNRWLDQGDRPAYCPVAGNDIGNRDGDAKVHDRKTERFHGQLSSKPFSFHFVLSMRDGNSAEQRKKLNRAFS